MGEIKLLRHTSDVYFRVLKFSMIIDVESSCNFCYDEKPRWRSCEKFSLASGLMVMGPEMRWPDMPNLLRRHHKYAKEFCVKY